MKDSLGDRMKISYESRSQTLLTRRIPVIIRLDGKNFHSLTRAFDKPFDYNLISIMDNVTQFLCQEVQGVKCAYVQSDEISLLLSDMDTIHTGAWFDYNVQKITSISASIATYAFNEELRKSVVKYYINNNYGVFDARAFNIPTEEVPNYYIWRQKDWIRNSISMFARSYFSHNTLNGKSAREVLTMLEEKNLRWNELPDSVKNGRFFSKVDGKFCKSELTPDFIVDRQIFNDLLTPKESEQ